MERSDLEKPILKILPAVLEGKQGWDYWLGKRLELWVSDSGSVKAFDYRTARWLQADEISPRLESYSHNNTQE